MHDSARSRAASESRNRAIAEAALDSIITVDPQGCILEFNPAAERTFGLSRATEAIEFVATGEGLKVAVVPD